MYNYIVDKSESVAAKTYSCFYIVCITSKYDMYTNKMQISEFHSQVLHLKKSHTLNACFSAESNIVEKDNEQFVVASIVDSRHFEKRYQYKVQ